MRCLTDVRRNSRGLDGRATTEGDRERVFDIPVHGNATPTVVAFLSEENIVRKIQFGFEESHVSMI